MAYFHFRHDTNHFPKNPCVTFAHEIDYFNILFFRFNIFVCVSVSVCIYAMCVLVPTEVRECQILQNYELSGGVLGTK